MKALIPSEGYGTSFKLLLYSAIAIIILISHIASAQTILFDSTTGFFGFESNARNGFMNLKFELEKTGFSVTDTVSMKGNSLEIDKSVLKRAKIFVIVNPVRELSFSEISALMDFVSNGGKLLVICDNPRYIGYANRIASVFGGTFTNYYIEQVEIPQYGAELKSSISLQVEDADFAVTVNTWANKWFDLFKIGEEKYYGNYTVFATRKVGKGVVAFLADKDFMTNENIYVANNTDFVKLVFEMPIASKSEEFNKVIKINISPKSIDVSASNKTVVVSLMIRNVGSNLSLSIEIPSYLEGLVVPFENLVNISSGEYKILRFLIKPCSDYGEIMDYIILRNSGGEEIYIPIRVVWK